MIDGKQQPAGREYSCGGFHAEEKDGRAVVTMDLAGAYEERAVQSLWRTLEFDLASGGLSVRDDVRLGSGQTMTENLVTQLLPVVEGGRVLLFSGEMRCVLTLPEGTEVRILEYDHSNHKGTTEKVYAIQWDVMLTEGAGSCRYSMELEWT